MVNLKKDLAEMQEWMTQAEEDYLERDFEYKSPEELESAVEEMKVSLGQLASRGLISHLLCLNQSVIYLALEGSMYIKSLTGKFQTSRRAAPINDLGRGRKLRLHVWNFGHELSP